MEFIAATLEACGAIEENEVQAIFSRLDADENGRISREDLKEVLAKDFSYERANNLIAEVDRNSDGEVSPDEFLNLFKSKNNSMLGILELEERGRGSISSVEDLEAIVNRYSISALS